MNTTDNVLIEAFYKGILGGLSNLKEQTRSILRSRELTTREKAYACMYSLVLLEQSEECADRLTGGFRSEDVDDFEEFKHTVKSFLEEHPISGDIATA